MNTFDLSIPPSHPCLPGHFPGHPVVPGVVVLERVLVALETLAGPLPALQLPQVKFRRPLLPGERARIELEPPVAGGRRWRFRVLLGDGPLATGEIEASA